MGNVFLVPVLWEQEPLLASGTFQTQIDAPEETEILLGVLWSWIGSPLPESILRPDGTRYDSGTAFEFEQCGQTISFIILSSQSYIRHALKNTGQKSSRNGRTCQILAQN